MECTRRGGGHDPARHKAWYWYRTQNRMIKFLSELTHPTGIFIDKEREKKREKGRKERKKDWGKQRKRERDKIETKYCRLTK